jgi:hypothetical protein
MQMNNRTTTNPCERSTTISKPTSSKTLPAYKAVVWISQETYEGFSLGG